LASLAGVVDPAENEEDSSITVASYEHSFAEYSGDMEVSLVFLSYGI
jgi:hypothetical protein